MNNLLNAEIMVFQQKLNGHVMLFNYRMMNLCVKAEPAALMPATIHLADGSYNIEDTANIEKPDDYHFKITPKNPNNMPNVIEGIFEIHPEFKMEEGSEKNALDKVVHFLTYEMPYVDKDRRDLLNETTKGFHKECIARLDTEMAAQTATFVDMLVHAPAAEADEARRMIQQIYDDTKDSADDLLKAKLVEIEDGYQRYLKEQEKEKIKEAENFDYSKGMRLSYGDE